MRDMEMETFGIRVPQHIFWHMQWDEFLFTWISLRSATRQTRDKNMIFFLTDIVNCLPATGADIHNRSKHVPFDATVCQRRYIINYTQCERRKKCAIKLMLPLINVNHDENDAACQVIGMEMWLHFWRQQQLWARVECLPRYVAI